MQQNNQHINKKYFPMKATLVMVLLLTITSIALLSFRNEHTYRHSNFFVNDDSVQSVRAFMQVYKVLKSPRCMNCHPVGDAPLQGDDSHTHTMNVKRGKDGNGLYAVKCSNCHQSVNTPGLHTPPGNPNWKLPPANMKMVFQGRSAHDLALQLMDYNRNGRKNKEQLLAHASDTLLKSGWHMGEGRTLPPLSYNDFYKAWNTWIVKGAYAPR
jgi:hypothetical protein